MKELNWLELLNRLYLVAWVVFSTTMIPLALNEQIRYDDPYKVIKGAGAILFFIVAPYIFRSVVRWVYAGLQTKKTG